MRNGVPSGRQVARKSYSKAKRKQQGSSDGANVFFLFAAAVILTVLTNAHML